MQWLSPVIERCLHERADNHRANTDGRHQCLLFAVHMRQTKMEAESRLSGRTNGVHWQSNVYAARGVPVRVLQISCCEVNISDVNASCRAVTLKLGEQEGEKQAAL